MGELGDSPYTDFLISVPPPNKKVGALWILRLHYGQRDAKSSNSNKTSFFGYRFCLNFQSSQPTSVKSLFFCFCKIKVSLTRFFLPFWQFSLPITCREPLKLGDWNFQDLRFAGSKLSWTTPRSDVVQATYTCVPLLLSSIIWYRPRW